MNKIPLIILTFFLAYSPINDQFKSGNDLYEALNSEWKYTKNFGMYMFANGYITGVYDSFHESLFQPKKGLTHGEVEDIVNNYLKENPGIRKNRPYLIIIDALKKAFPIKETPVFPQRDNNGNRK